MPLLMRKHPQFFTRANPHRTVNKFPENLSQFYMCVYVCTSLERRGGDQSFPERIPDYPPTEGKNQNPRERMQKKEKKKYEGEEAALYVIAPCIIYKETWNNSGGCLSAMCWRAMLPQRLKEMPQCTHTRCSSPQMLLSTVKHSRYEHVTLIFCTLMPKCFCMSVLLRSFSCSFRGRREASLPPTDTMTLEGD